MALKTAPKALLLDLGNVIFELDWEKPIQTLGLRGSRLEKILLHQIQAWGPYDQYERGKLTTDEFLIFLNQNCDHPIKRADFLEAWQSLIAGYFIGMEELLEKLSDTLPLYALTNTNPAHYDYILSLKGMSHFRQIFSSVTTGFRKPENQIFETVLETLELPPEEILYIDDTESHVEAAKALGFRAEVFRGSSATDLIRVLWRHRIEV